MSFALTQARSVRRLFLSLGVVALLFGFSPASAVAQSGGIDIDPLGEGIGPRSLARHTIEGRIYLPTGRQLERPARITVSGIAGGEVSVMSDDNGAFIVRRLQPGRYSVVIDAGREFARVIEMVDIVDLGRSGRGQSVALQIRLQLAPSRTQGQPGVIDAAMANVPREALELYQKALEAARAGDSRKAIEHLREAVRLHPEFALAYNELGAQHMRLRQHDEAAQAFRTALSLAPDALAPRLNYGILLIQRRQFAEAETELRRALQRNDNFSTARLYLGRALISLDRHEEAERELRRVIAQGGNDEPLAHRFLGALYNARGDDARAIQELEAYLRLAPTARDANEVRRVINQLRAPRAASQP